MSNELKYNLDTNIDRPQILKCKQYDNRTAILSLYSNSVPFNVTGATLMLNAYKADETYVKQTDNMSISNNVVTITLNPQITTYAGEVKLELKTTLSSKNITTFDFILKVEPSVIPANSIASSTSIDATQMLDNKISTATTIKTQLETDINNGNTAVIRSDLDGVMSGQINPNLVPNGSFEAWTGTSPDYWVFGAHTSITKVSGFNSSNGIRLQSSTGGNDGYNRMTTDAGLLPNTTYTLSCWVRRGTGTGNLNLVIDFTGVFTITNTGSASYAKYTVTFTTSSNTSNAIAFMIDTANDAFYIDLVKIEKGNISTSYAERVQSMTDISLNTANKTIIGGINELDGQVGDMSTVNTNAKTCAGAIIEMNAKVSVLASGNNGTFYWTKLHDGTIIQYGRGAGYQAGNEYDITFPVAFPNKCYFAIAETISRDDISIAYTEYVNVRTSNVDKTKLHLKVGEPITGAQSMTFNIGWVAVGR